VKTLVLIFALAVCAAAQDLKEFEKHITEFTLANGLHFIVLERHSAPVVSFHTYVNAGSVDDPKGKSGIAHMFEHMAFKGTDTIGTTNYAAETRSLAEIERIYDQIQVERDKRAAANGEKLKKLEESLDSAIEKSREFVVPNLYPRIIEESGGVGLNAGTSEDSTSYFYNLPSNRAELWFYLESARFLHPVLREFYVERDVVREERRMRTESEAIGRLQEAMLSTAMQAHPYRVPPVGWASDIENLRTADARAFFDKYYVAANITIAIVGDVDPAAIKTLATRYFGRLPKKPMPDPVATVEPKQDGQKRVEIISPSQPIELIAYHRPDQYDKDDPVFDVIESLVAGGRTSLIYKELVRDKKIALQAGAEADTPGGKYPGLFFFYLVPNQGHTAEENEKALDAVLEKFKTEKVDDASMARVKIRTRAGLIRQLDSNAGLAQLLASTYASYGDWRKLFTSIDDIDKVTADDVQRVARQYFIPENRTVAVSVMPAGGTK
jgi:predicted Zn-dependent peptidase